MIPSYKRLSGKDIGYMLHRGKKLYGDIFICIYIDQYPNRTWHQVSIQIPVKCDKRATMRNLLKRKAQTIFLDLLEQIPQNSMYGYKKFFLYLNKKDLQKIRDLLATGSKTTIIKQRREYCKKDFTFFLSTIGKTQSKNLHDR